MPQNCGLFFDRTSDVTHSNKKANHRYERMNVFYYAQVSTLIDRFLKNLLSRQTWYQRPFYQLQTFGTETHIIERFGIICLINNEVAQTFSVFFFFFLLEKIRFLTPQTVQHRFQTLNVTMFDGLLPALTGVWISLMRLRSTW